MLLHAPLNEYVTGVFPDGRHIVVWATTTPHADRLAKADNALAPGEKWITLKPHGPDHPSYVHVKIRENPDGSANVINGPGGLRGLKLTRGPGDGPKRGRDRKPKPPPDETPEQKAAREAREDSVKRSIEAVQADAIKAAAELTQDKTFERLLDPQLKDTLKSMAAAKVGGDAPGKHAAGVAAAAGVRKVTSAVNQVTRNVMKELISDPELRAAVLTPEDKFDAADASPAPAGGPGYQTNLKGRAQEQGFTPEDAKAEGDKFFRARIEKMIDDGDTEAAARAVAARERMRAAAPLIKPAGEAVAQELPKPETSVPAPEIRERADAARKLIAAHQKLKDLNQKLRRVRQGQDPDATPDETDALNTVLDDNAAATYTVAYEEVSPDFRERLEADLKSLEAEELTRSFLEALDDDSGEPGADVRRQLQAPHGAGAFAHLNNTLLATLGADTLDRTVVDVLGANAAAELAAHALLRDLPEDERDALRESLERYHDDVSVREMRNALDDAKAAREEANNIEVPPITDSEDAAIVTRLLEDKREHLAAAHKALGNALGRVEAGAALNLALQRGRQEKVLANLGAANAATASTNLRALGLKDGDYELHQDAKGNMWAHITASGMDALTPKADPAERDLQREISAIKAGAEDEEDWLPSGFTRYSSADLSAEPPLPESYARSWASLTNPDAPLAEQVTDLIATRLADGWSPSEVARHMTRQDLISGFVPTHEQDAFHEALRELLPATAGTELKEAKDGTKYEAPIYVDYDNLAEKHPEIHERLERVTNEWLEKNRPEAGGYKDQQLADNEQSRKALHMTLMQDPRTRAAFKAPTDLSEPDKRGIRNYWLSEIAGQTPEKIATSNAEAKQAAAEFEEANPKPDKWVAGGGGGLFGGDPEPLTSVTLKFTYADDTERRAAAIKNMGLSAEQGHYVEPGDGSIVLTQAGMDALRAPDPEYASGRDMIHGLENLNPEYLNWNARRREFVGSRVNIENTPEWTEFVQDVGGTHHAYEAVQEHMRSAVSTRFAQAYARTTGQPLKLGRASNKYGEAMLALTDPDLAKELKALRAQEQQSTRERSGGQFAYMGGKGSVLEAARKLREAKRAEEQAQVALFGGGGGMGGDQSAERSELVPGLERHELPEGVTNRLAAMTEHIGQSLDPAGSPVKLIPDMTMGAGTRFVKQQRAIKANLKAKKMALFLGVGSGKTAVSIGMFTELHHKGEAKKGLYVVPSIVRDQFGEEMSRTLKPGEYQWHAREASYDERLQQYRNPDTHMVAVTHQSFRDDMLRIMAEHHGEKSVGGMTERFLAASPEERKDLMRAALEAKGIPLDYMAVDEAHDALNRAGKQESNLSAVLDTAMSLSNYGTLMTGSPVKNDTSEIHDWLKKVDPDRFADRDEFHRKYGADVFASREALKRVADRYTYHDVVDPQTTKSVTWGTPGNGSSPSGNAPVPLSDWQQRALASVESAYLKASRAHRAGGVDVASMRVLSPNSFEGAPEDQHEGIARRLSRSLGTLKHSAHERVVNAAPPEHNAKLQHLVKLAEERRGKGGVVFAHSRATVAMSKAALERAGHKVAVLTGTDNARDKARIRRALDRGEVDIVIASDAGSTGANFQGRGEWLVNIDLPMTQKTMEQRNARIDRLGQERPIELHHLMSDSDFDRDNYERLERKRSLGEIFQGESELMDDTGLAKYLSLSAANRPADEDQGGLF